MCVFTVAGRYRGGLLFITRRLCCRLSLRLKKRSAAILTVFDSTGGTMNRKNTFTFPPPMITVHCPVHSSFRVQQIAGMFDVPLVNTLDNPGGISRTFDFEMPPLSPDQPGGDWKIGCIVGPSGSGKSVFAKDTFRNNYFTGGKWKPETAAGRTHQQIDASLRVKERQDDFCYENIFYFVFGRFICKCGTFLTLALSLLRLLCDGSRPLSQLPSPPPNSRKKS